MKNVLISAVAALSITMTGCASNKQIDPTPVKLDKTDSFAMQVLKSGFDYVPFDIDDAEVAEDAYSNKVGYGASTTLGFLANGGVGALGGFGMAAIINAGGDVRKDLMHYIAWVPADNIDINDKAAIDEYIKLNYLKPAADAFIASEHNKNMDHPTEFVSYADGEYRVKGGACWPIMHGKEKYDECQIFWKHDVAPVRYADAASGLPFEPEEKANRYIVVRISDAFYGSSVVLPYLKSNMIYAYVPAFGYKAEHLNRFAPADKPMVSNKIPFIAGKNSEANFFIKLKK
ncbi:hypothetical protein AB6D66_00185 [Vibrio pomeroyi]|uniref:Lipoprotein n=1 Tax=Vibrio pomeroyi TaxID=198832 RepID=A0ABV4MQR8_9VIBR|nr:hypothetical protein [Vibrio atlanticus]MCZ4310965.1 hypothetical protein [Vibrio atlanticus]